MDSPSTFTSAISYPEFGVIVNVALSPSVTSTLPSVRLSAVIVPPSPAVAVMANFSNLTFFGLMMK